MGLEAYRMGLVFREHSDKETVKNCLEKIGIEVISKEKNFDILLEKKYNEGFIEFMIREMDNKNADVSLRIAKPNSDKVLDYLFELLRTLSEFKEILKIKDYELKKDFALSDTSLIRANFIKLKTEFVKWYPDLPYPIRCEEVFDEYHKLHIDEYKTE